VKTKALVSPLLPGCAQLYRGLVPLLLCALLLSAAGLSAQTAPPAAQISGQEAAQPLTLAVGKSILIEGLQPVKRIAVGAPEIAEATAISHTEILVNGKAAGETSLILWDINGGRQFYNLSVHAGASQVDRLQTDRMQAVLRQLALELPGQKLQVSGEGDTLFLRGTVKDLSAADRAVKIASTAGKVVNLLNVDVPQAEPQILLKVHFASIDLTKASQMGINIFSLGLANTLGGITTGQFSPPTITSSSTGNAATFSNELNILALKPGALPVGVDIQAMESTGVAEVLAEPNLLAANGKQASFLAGGEYPYPVVQSGSGGSVPTITIMFKDYGVRLNFIPTITPRGTIRLQVAPEVSALDFSNEIEISGFEVPAITSRKVNTEVELADGQSFVIGGLLDNRMTETFQKIPFLGDIPILGKFFQSMSKSRTNTELIVIVTPEIVAPIPAGAPLPKLNYPQGFLPPNSSIDMHQPDAKTPANTPAPAPAALPVEKLIDSMKPETPLQLDDNKTAPTGGSAPATPAAPANQGP